MSRLLLLLLHVAQLGATPFAPTNSTACLDGSWAQCQAFRAAAWRNGSLGTSPFVPAARSLAPWDCHSPLRQQCNNISNSSARGASAQVIGADPNFMVEVTADLTSTWLPTTTLSGVAVGDFNR